MPDGTCHANAIAAKANCLHHQKVRTDRKLRPGAIASNEWDETQVLLENQDPDELKSKRSGCYDQQEK